MARLCRRQPSKDHDAQGRRVHKKVPSSCFTISLCTDTPLRPAGKQKPQRQHRVMSWVPRNRQNRNKRKSQAGNLAGTVAQNLRDRCHYLSRMSERKDVQDSAVAPLSVQQSTGVTQMSIVHNVKTISPASCEKNVLLRHVLLLPKIVHSYLSGSSVGQSIPMLTPVTDQYRYKRGNKAPTHLLVYRKNKEEMIESP
jgi:hypothetical protein